MVKKDKTKHKYVFPDFLAKAMSKVDLRTQYEASMLSMTLMSLGLVVTITYLIIYLDFPTWYKVVLGINGLAGIVFMWSFLVTTFQQYQNYMQVVDFQKQQPEEPKEEPKRKGMGDMAVKIEKHLFVEDDIIAQTDMEKDN